MKIRNHNAASRLSAACLLALFLSGWLAVPAKFAWSEPAACEMACCLVSRHLSCEMHSTSKAGSRLKDGHHHSGDEASDDEHAGRTTKISLNAVSAPCSSQCGLPPSGLQKISVPKPGLAGCSISSDTAQLIYVRAPHFARDTLIAESHAPRAPPITPL